MKPIQYLDRKTWAFWARAATWTRQEATVILSGYMPFRGGGLADPDDENSYFSFEHMGAANYFELVGRKFPDDQVETSKFFPWIREMNFWVPDDLLSESSKLNSNNTTPSTVRTTKHKTLESDGRGSAAAKKRNQIVCAALQYLNQVDRNERDQYFKNNGGLNVSKLSAEINDQRGNLPAIANIEYGAAEKNIAETLYATLNQETSISTE
jgi:hypothetical protein